MSGRRSSKAEGSPAGISGTASTKSVGAIVSSAGGTPISTAIACSNCARVTPTAIACAWVALQLGLGLRHIRLRGGAGGILVAGDAQRLGEGRGRVVEQPLQLVGDAQLQIVAGERALGREPRIGEIGGARLGGRDIGLDRAADLAPEIGGPARGDRVAEKAPDPAAAADHEG